MTTLTVFTPTFNRAHTLTRVFASLQGQSSRDFRWLVVDDGSTDDTRTLVARWQAAADFAVDYMYQQNRGKHSAHNAAVARAATPLFMIVDSDDELLPRAVELITTTWAAMSDAERATVAGIWTLCADPAGRIVGGPFPRDSFDASLQELKYTQSVDKEMLPTFVTEVLKRHPFPETGAGVCPYIPESYVWMQITRTRPLRFLNVPCRVYHQGDGLSEMARSEYPLSRCIVFGYLSPLANDFAWFSRRPAAFFSSAVQAGRYGIFARIFWQLAGTLTWRARLLLISAAPLSIALLARDWLTGRIARQLNEAQHQRKASAR